MSNTNLIKEKIIKEDNIQILKSDFIEKRSYFIENAWLKMIAHIIVGYVSWHLFFYLSHSYWRFSNKIDKIIIGTIGTIISMVVLNLILKIIFKIVKIIHKKNYKKQSIEAEQKVYNKIKEYENIANNSIINEKIMKDSKLLYTYCYYLKKQGELDDKFPTPKKLSISAEEQYDFLKKEMDSITKGVIDTIEEYYLANLENIKNILSEKNWSIQDLTNEIIKLHKYYNNPDEKVELLKSTINQDVFFSELFDYCESQGITFNHNRIYDVNESLNDVLPFFDTIFKDMFTQFAGIKKGYDGEKKVDEHLNLYTDILTNISGVRLELEGTSIETDNVVITDKGVFLIEVKNYGKAGETIEISKDGKWKRYTEYERYDNKIKRTPLEIKNVQEQHNRHIGIMQRYINKELMKKGLSSKYIEFEPIIVIANDDVEVVNESDIPIFRTSNIYDYIRKCNTGMVLSEEVQQEIINILNANKLKSKSYDIVSYEKAFVSRFKYLVNQVCKQMDFNYMYTVYINQVEASERCIHVKTIHSDNIKYKEKYIFIE